MTGRAANRYLARVLLLVGITLTFALFFNLLVDPFGITRWITVDGVNANKPVQRRYSRLWKPFAVRARQPDTIVLGASRSDHGIDVNDANWGQDTHNRFNLSADSANIFEIARLLEHAASASPVKHVVVGLEFFSFRSVAINEGLYPDLLMSSDYTLAKAAVKWLDINVSYGTLRESVATVLGQALPLHFRADGNRTDAVFLQRLRDSGGPYEAFTRFEIDAVIPTATAPWQDAVYERALAEYRSFVRYACGRQLDLRLFISPVHARELQIQMLAGVWDQYEQWKRDLKRIVIEENSRQGRPCVEHLWDFATFNTVTSEEIPRPGSRQVMEFFWDGAHYKANVGSLVLARLFGPLPEETPRTLNFGTDLLKTDLEPYLQRIRRAGDAYRGGHVDELRELEQRVAKAKYASQ